MYRVKQLLGGEIKPEELQHSSWRELCHDQIAE
ncbi:hypothetical protein VAA_03893 [Vibrio anguillarum 775]|nr:hypothetical protein VAA_03893 [Vibrio anguillarum 775]